MSNIQNERKKSDDTGKEEEEGGKIINLAKFVRR
jgi:hypothetical protein